MNQKGQSLVELIVAIGIFTAIASSMTYLIVDSFSTNRQGEELTRATALMNQGYEAAVSIRDQGWGSLATGNHGINDSGGAWSFSGESNQDINGKYDRVVNVTEIDENTKKVTTTISWEYFPGQTTQIQGLAYLTNWQGSGAQPTPIPGSCATCCQSLGYLGGTCRTNQAACTEVSETMESSCNKYCTGHVCCCQPAPTPTLTPTPGPTATPTFTPTPTEGPASCNDYCIGLGCSEGICRENTGKCSNNDEVHFEGGDTYCPHTEGENVCCCK